MARDFEDVPFPAMITRRLKMQRKGETQVHEVSVKFGFPEKRGERGQDGHVLTRVQTRLESQYWQRTDHADGADDVSALLGALLVAKAHLERLARDGDEICWLSAGDLNDDRFWGYHLGFRSL